MLAVDLASGLFRSVKNLPRRLFGTRNDRILKQYHRHIDPIGAFDSDLRGHFDETLAQSLKETGLDRLEDEERIAEERKLRVDFSLDLRERLQSLRERIDLHSAPLESWWQSLPAKQQMDEYYRKEYRSRDAKVVELLDAEGINYEAFALLREASRRAQNHRHFDCQLTGGRVLYEGRIAEMRTGEGKTIVGHLPAMMNFLRGRKAHLITVND